MLPGGLDPLYRAVLAASHRLDTRVEIWSQGVRIDDYGPGGLPLTGGAVVANLASRVVRTVSLSTTERYFPDSVDVGLLLPWDNYLKIFQSVGSYGGPTYEWCVYYGRILTCALSDDGGVAVTSSDRANDVATSFFQRPQQSQEGSLIGAQLKVLISDALTDATFGAFDPIWVTTPNLVWQNDRAGACDQLGSAANAYWYPLANGDFVLRTIPWTTGGDPLLTLDDGPTGTLSGWTVAYSRDGVSDTVTVIGELADGSDPVYATASDLDPTSPTYVNGAFGVKGRQILVQTATSQGQVQSLAAGYLRQDRALTDTWAATVVVDPALELGDPLLLSAMDGTRRSSVQVVSGYTLPLTGNALMSVAFRAQTPGAVLNESA